MNNSLRRTSTAQWTMLSNDNILKELFSKESAKTPMIRLRLCRSSSMKTIPEQVCNHELCSCVRVPWTSALWSEREGEKEREREREREKRERERERDEPLYRLGCSHHFHHIAPMDDDRFDFEQKFLSVSVSLLFLREKECELGGERKWNGWKELQPQCRSSSEVCQCPRTSRSLRKFGKTIQPEVRTAW